MSYAPPTPAASAPYGIPLAPNKATPGEPSSLEGLIEVVGFYVNRLREAVENSNYFANCLDGGQPQTATLSDNKADPLPNGHIAILEFRLREMNTALNELTSHHGRIGRSISG